MRKYSDDKYTREGDENSQVRNIINQLNVDNASRERSREVVTRPDGTKVVRVTKKRRVLVSEKEKNRRSRKNFLITLLTVFVLACGFAAYVVYRAAVMCSADYLAEKQQDICKAWGATSVVMQGTTMEGTTLKVATLVAEFPDSSNIERIELKGITAPLSIKSFVSGIFSSEDVNIQVADIRLRSDVKALNIPQWQGEGEIWKFSGVHCSKLSCSIGSPESSPVLIREAEAHIYPVPGDENAHKISLRNGKFRMKRFEKNPMADNAELKLIEASFDVYPDEVKWVRIACQHSKRVVQGAENSAVQESVIADGVAYRAEALSVSNLVFTAEFKNGDSIYGPYKVEAQSIPLSFFTGALFERVLTANVYTGQADTQPLTCVFGAASPFSGNVGLRHVEFACAALPALPAVIAHHMQYANGYKKDTVLITNGRAVIHATENDMTLEIPHGAMIENGDLSIGLCGKLAVALPGGYNRDLPDTLLGEIEYSLPRTLVDWEYLAEDGSRVIDPIFSEDERASGCCKVVTQVTGTPNRTTDNLASLVAQTQEIRASYKRNPVPVDFDAVSEKIDVLAPAVQSSDNVFDILDAPIKSAPGNAPSSSAQDPFKLPDTVPADPSINL